jgi:hypothetical protein
MRRSILMAIVVLSFILNLLGAYSWAGCVQQDLQGTWDFYSVGGDAASGWSGRGHLKLSSSGKVQSGGFVTSWGGKFQFLGGKITVSSTCVIKGNIKASNDLTIMINHGTLGKDGLYFSWQWSDNAGSFGVFIGIKN